MGDVVNIKQRYVRVFWMPLDGGLDGDGAWYWCPADSLFKDLPNAEVRGPFDNAITAGIDARSWVEER